MKITLCDQCDGKNISVEGFNASKTVVLNIEGKEYILTQAMARKLADALEITGKE
jgi:ribosome-binding protein aMBF1 (putative translation factor)